MLNKQILKIIQLLAIITMLLAGCYNNSHVRTQRMIKQDEPVFSGHMAINVISPNDFDGINQSGVSGLRLGVSYLGLHGGFEQGITLDAGTVNNVSDYILGYDIRKFKIHGSGQAYRYGLYLESNFIEKNDNKNLRSGQVFQFRPYLNTVTSEEQNWYVGAHGLLSFGSLTAEQHYYYWDSPSNETFEYRVASMGAGVTVGTEFRSGKILMQTQLDVSVVNQTQEALEQIDNQDNWGAYAFDNTGLVVSVGVAAHIATPKTPSRRKRSGTIKRSTDLIQSMEGSYDPFSGIFIASSRPENTQKFNPVTGEAVLPESEHVYDPSSGEVVVTTNIEAPHSLLTVGQQSKLLSKKLYVTTLNGTNGITQVVDIRSDGIMIFQTTVGKAGQKLIKYEDIQNIQFEGPRNGLSGGMKGIISGCALGLAIPLGATVITSDDDAMFFSLISAPVGVIGGFIYGAVSRDSYGLELKKSFNSEEELKHKRMIFYELVSLFLESGFPAYDLTQTMNGVKD